MKLTFITAVPALLFALALGACKTAPLVIPEDLSNMELIQRAQEASDRNRYGVSLQYYQALLDRNPTNPTMICTAEYEIAFVYYKQRRFADAKAGLRSLLTRYTAPDAEILPPEYQILANIVLKEIAKKEQPVKFDPFDMFKKKQPESVTPAT